MVRRRSRCTCRCMCRAFFLLVFLTTTALVSFDLYTHGSYAASRTREFIEEKGMVAAIKAAFINVFYYFAKVWLWLIENVPVWCVEAWELSGPYREMVWKLLVEVGEWMVDLTKPPRAWLESLSPEVYGMLSNFLSIIWEYLGYLVSGIFKLAIWIRDNVFVGSLAPENIIKVIRNILAFIPNYIRTCVEGEDADILDESGEQSDIDEEEVPESTQGTQEETTKVPPPTPKTPPPPPVKKQAPPPPPPQTPTEKPAPTPTEKPVPAPPKPSEQPKAAPASKVPEPEKKHEVPKESKEAKAETKATIKEDPPKRERPVGKQ